MKALTMILFPDAPEQVAIGLTHAEAKTLVDDLQELCGLACDGGSMGEETARLVDRVTVLAQLLQHQLSHLVVAASAAGPAPKPSQEAAGTFKGIPMEHVEWALKVYALTTSHSRASEHPVIQRTFEKGEAQAKSFFAQTQNVWNIRVRGGEAPAFEVQLGVQDARKHRKKGSFREVDRALCTG